MTDLSKRLREMAGARRTDDILGVKNMLLREAADALDARWQTMESAPRDGTWVLLYRPEPKHGRWKRIVIGRWWKPWNSWVWTEGVFDILGDPDVLYQRIESGWFEDERDVGEAYKFSRWHPFTPPPEDV